MLRIGITGQSGFVGTHLYNEIGLLPGVERVFFEDAFFQSSEKLNTFVKQCDVIVHLAAMNRHDDLEFLYRTNVNLCKLLIESMEVTGCKPHVLFSSSTQEENDNLYGKSKRAGRELLEQWAIRNKASFTGMVVPNVFGSFGQPNYNSFIATFCYKLTHGETPVVQEDCLVRLIYVGSLCKHIIAKIKSVQELTSPKIDRDEVPFDFERKVTSVLKQLEKFRSLYFEKGIIPCLPTTDDVNIFNTFRCFINQATHFPVKLIQHVDTRGIFVETIKLGIGGQVSFSTTIPQVTRGNHYHTRKIERFTVMKGKALIQLRKIGTSQILNFYLDGDEPSYVDIPIWYTHNIKNIGEEELLTQFWINEWYNPEDEDTFLEQV